MNTPKFHLVTHTKGVGRVDTIILFKAFSESVPDVYETCIFWANGDSDVVAHYKTQEKAEFGHGVYSHAMRRKEITWRNIHDFDPVF